MAENCVYEELQRSLLCNNALQLWQRNAEVAISTKTTTKTTSIPHCYKKCNTSSLFAIHFPSNWQRPDGKGDKAQSQAWQQLQQTLAPLSAATGGTRVRCDTRKFQTYKVITHLQREVPHCCWSVANERNPHTYLQICIQASLYIYVCVCINSWRRIYFIIFA